MTYPYDKTGCSGSTSTTDSAIGFCSSSHPSRSAPTTTNTYPPPRPTQVLNGPTLENREYDYLAFGGTYQPGTKITVKQRYAYAGRELNPTSALMYYRYRQYDPRVGRSGARDPLVFRPDSGEVMPADVMGLALSIGKRSDRSLGTIVSPWHRGYTSTDAGTNSDLLSVEVKNATSDAQKGVIVAFTRCRRNKSDVVNHHRLKPVAYPSTKVD